ncbi:LIC_10190 family membrane protein [Dysgonomonas sp. ZJ279]|uniref:LIC_10190 family membrane protein n=1 Tax=Dysgonomonas sp. ZJ279 TaxID=2709796 RepID=UPI0013ED098C|nr:hypothetical protein [Dysgonomonas sp. ZJ279]
MLIVLLVWVAITIVLHSYGAFFIHLYNRICNKDEQYSLLDTFLLGIPFVLIVLSAVSFFFPINVIVVSTFLLSSLLYSAFMCKKTHLFTRIREYFEGYSLSEKIFLFLFVLPLVIIVAWGASNFDPACYHYQSVRWIEEFAAVPGLANLEERIGFNSNYLLLSSLFTFRFLLVEPIFAIQGLLSVGVFLWVFHEMVKSGYELRRCFLLFLYLLFLYLGFIHIGDSSTDIVPNLIVFYLVSKLILNPQILKSNILLYTVVLITLATFKLSIAFIACISLFVIITLYKNKEIKSLVFILCMSSLIFGMWMGHNVIISGYLIHPLYEIDLFDFDWKLPREISIIERRYIHDGALWQLKYVYHGALTLFYAPSTLKMHYYFTALVYVLAGVSPIAFLFAFYKKAWKESIPLALIYGVLIICLLGGFVSTPDIRFVSGILFSMIFISVVQVFNVVGTTWFIKKRELFLAVMLLPYLFLAAFYLQGVATPACNMRTVVRTIVRPRPLREKIWYPEEVLQYDTFKLNDDVEIYIIKEPSGLVFYKFPSVPYDSEIHQFWRFQSYKSIEARGTSLKDGFRMKKGYYE